MAYVSRSYSSPVTSSTPTESRGEASQAREIKNKVSELVARRFGGDTQAAFNHYAKDGVINRAGLVKLLGDAGVGNGLTRGMWADGILDKLDTDGDRAVTWAEFQRVAGN